MTLVKPCFLGSSTIILIFKHNFDGHPQKRVLHIRAQTIERKDKTNTVKTSIKNRHKDNTESSANLKRNVQNANGKERLSDMCNLRTGQKSCRKCPARFYCSEFKRKKAKLKGK